MAFFQVVEKDSYATDWALVRYHDASVSRYNTELEAIEVAKKYVTDQNVNNALAAGEKQSAAEVYIMLGGKVFLGVLDGKDWFMLDRHKKEVTEKNYYELEGKGEVAVRPIPGT